METLSPGSPLAEWSAPLESGSAEGVDLTCLPSRGLRGPNTALHPTAASPSFSSGGLCQAAPLLGSPFLPRSSLSPPHPSVHSPPSSLCPQRCAWLVWSLCSLPAPSQIPSLRSLKARAESMIFPESGTRSSPSPGTVLVTRFSYGRPTVLSPSSLTDTS